MADACSVDGWVSRGVCLGAGAYGDVYAVEHAATRRRGALKRQALFCDGELCAAAVREAALLRAAASPNVVALLDECVYEGTVYLVLERMEETMHARCRIRRLSPAEVLTTARQCLRALAFLHERCIAHRDVKPANLLATRPDAHGVFIVKLADFGLARFVHDAPNRLFTRDVITLWYRPPELLRAPSSSVQYGVEVDVWALGVTLWELAHGAPFVTARHPAEQLRRTEALALDVLLGGVQLPTRAMLDARPAMRARAIDELLRLP